MKKAVIIPYFGNFNSYFNLWLHSCGYNNNTDFLIFTDNEISENIPSNVIVIKMTFDHLKDMAGKKTKMNINLDVPYKLCDYKPYYGYIFDEYLREYDFWGYCDCDLIFGQIDSFITDSLFQEYDKILRTGHLSFIRNTEDINKNFLKFDTYKIVMKSPVIYGYDESVNGYHFGFAGELMYSGYRFFQNDRLVADVDFRNRPFFVVSNRNNSCVFEFDHGKVNRIDFNGKSIERKEMMYVHFQKRKMVVRETINKDHFLMIPNEFITYDESILQSMSFWEKIREEKGDYFDIKMEKAYERKRSLMRWLYEPHKIKSLLYRMRHKR